MKQISLGMLKTIEGGRANGQSREEIISRLCKIYNIPENRADDAIIAYDSILVIP